MPVGPQEQELLALVASEPSAESPELDPTTLRKGFAAMSAMAGPGPDVEVRDLTIPGPGGDLPIRTYTPSGDGPFGALVYLHGGGWTIGSLDTHDHPCRTLCHDAGIVVVSVDYRLAPEHPFPAALDDAWAGLNWVVDHAAELNIDLAALAVGGDSAGGNLAAVLALRARDRGGPALAFQLLIYPAVDLRADGPDRYRSLTENASGYLLTLDHIKFFMGNYRPDATAADDWQMSPLLASDHSGLPPALVITAEFDPLRDEGRTYAETLAAAGTPVTHTLYEGTIHTMFQLAPVLDAGQRALAESVSAMRAVFDARPSPHAATPS